MTSMLSRTAEPALLSGVAPLMEMPPLERVLSLRLRDRLLACAPMLLAGLWACGQQPAGPGIHLTEKKSTSGQHHEHLNDGRSHEAPIGRIAAGLIIRDKETLRLITETSASSLPSGVGGSLKLIVRKARYRLEVWQADRLLKVYPIALGGAPSGPKRQQGDQRTPEGTYQLIPHHPSPSFGGCFYVMYPGAADADLALEKGIITPTDHDHILEALARGAIPPHDTALGGLILIHGTRRRWVPGLTTTNWTLGCIAMENDDLVELLTAFSNEDRPGAELLP